MSAGHRSLAERVLLARIYAFTMVAPLLMRLPPRRLGEIFGRTAAGRRRRWSTAELIAAVDHVLLSGKPLIYNDCKTRGLTRYFFLRRAGDDVSLVFGIGTVDARTEGHCWIERGGTPVYENRDPYEAFTTIWTIPAA